MLLLSTTEMANLSGDMANIFATMTQGRTITVIKAPLKTVVQTNTPNSVFGFGDVQSEPMFTYTPVSGVFPAIIRYATAPTNPLDADINARIYAGPVTIKVQQDCRDFIQNGKTDHILADGKAFLIDGEEKRQMLLNNVYYHYNLKATE